jgi:hypothetical protein
LAAVNISVLTGTARRGSFPWLRDQKRNPLSPFQARLIAYAATVSFHALRE